MSNENEKTNKEELAKAEFRLKQKKQMKLYMEKLLTIEKKDFELM